MKNRHSIKDSDIKEIIENLKPITGKGVEELLEGRVEKADLENDEKILIVNGHPAIIIAGEKSFPLIQVLRQINLKRVTVDMGAIKPITNGADIMAPGIVKVGQNIEEEDIVGIEDEKNHKIVAVGEALKQGSSMKGKSGKALKNLHYVGDRYWDLAERI